MRLDHKLVDLKMVKTRSQATDYIKRGLVLVNGQMITKPGHIVKPADFLQIETKVRFVSRGGEKLEQALEDFHIDLNGKIVIDIGSSTGGFTDCSLKRGAAKVFAYDVGKDQMDPTLKNDSRVELYEETNILDVELPPADGCFIDVSFTSIKPILRHLQGFKGFILALIKPQFEIGPHAGVVKDIKKHRQALASVLGEMIALGFHPQGLKKAALLGKKGNQEYMCYLLPDITSNKTIDEWIGDVL
ncbi:MAG: TlyA family RNA methyltransferase [Acholeplasmataceae bacterium]